MNHTLTEVTKHGRLNIMCTYIYTYILNQHCVHTYIHIFEISIALLNSIKMIIFESSVAQLVSRYHLYPCV